MAMLMTHPFPTRPYEYAAMDELERLSLAATLATFYLATYLLAAPAVVGPAGHAAISAAVLVLNVATTAVLALAIARWGAPMAHDPYQGTVSGGRQVWAAGGLRG